MDFDAEVYMCCLQPLCYVPTKRRFASQLEESGQGEELDSDEVEASLLEDGSEEEEGDDGAEGCGDAGNDDDVLTQVETNDGQKKI